jgi:hypothetical protein
MYKDTEIVKTEIVVVTPEMAKIMMEKNVGNRNMNDNRVALYTSYMKNGEWRQTGQGIICSEDGNVIDGQHRLEAIKKSNKSITMVKTTVRDKSGSCLTAVGVPIDLGQKRTVGNVLGISGSKIAILRMLIYFLDENGPELAKNPSYIEKIHDLYSDVFEMLPGSKSAIFSQAAIRAIFLLRLKLGQNYIEEYNNILNRSYQAISPLWASYMRRVEDSKNFTSHEHNKIIMAYTWYATSDDRQNQSRVNVREFQALIDEAKKAYKKIKEE